MWDDWRKKRVFSFRVIILMIIREIVNLSARHMQKAIYHAIDLTKETKKKVDYMMLIDERTKDVFYII